MNYELRIKNLRGFTLIELLIVVAIIGVLATLLMANFIGVRQRARDAQRKSDLRQIQSALEIYRSDNGTYPILAGSIGVCSSSLQFGGNTYMSSIPCDPNGNSYYNSGNYYYNSASGALYVLEACLENPNDKQGSATSLSGSPSPSSACSSTWYFSVRNP